MTERIWELIIAVLLAIVGCLSRILHKNIKMKMNRLFAELFVSGFAGCMMLFFVRLMGLSSDWLGLICGIAAGWIGPRSIDQYGEVVLRQISNGLRQISNGLRQISNILNTFIAKKDKDKKDK